MAGMVWRREHVPAVSLFNPSRWESGHLYSGWVSSSLITSFGNALKIYPEVLSLRWFQIPVSWQGTLQEH